MMTIVRLCWTYFTATTWCRWLSTIGLIVVMGGVLFPAAVAQSLYLPAVCFAGAATFFLGSSMMPVLFGRMAASHQLAFLPFGRLKLIASALLTTSLVVIPVPVMGMLISIEPFSKYALQTKLTPDMTFRNFLATHFFMQMCLVAFLWTTWMYFVLWSLTTSRNALGMLRTLLILIALIAIPPRYVAINNQTPLATVAVLIVLSWTLFIAYFLLLPRLRRSRLHAIYQSIRERWRGQEVSSKEMPLLLGISSPWILALAVSICIVLDSLFVPLRGPWLFFLVILALVSGAIAGKTAARSRALWLRLPHTRAELFDRVERLLWQHSAPSVA
ncbi:MAG TPA: hypothetical protein VK629_01415, partial [Steroidobacteraceae bacterium]|nr:hypothetical protein [Steroidobacteraceae bacterium]